MKPVRCISNIDTGMRLEIDQLYQYIVKYVEELT